MEDARYTRNGNGESFMAGGEGTGLADDARAQAEEAERRRARRLKEDLGINPAGVEVILRLRRHVVMLQARTRQLEIELRIEQARSEIRLERLKGSWHG